jgi:hypothetical protein
MAGRFVDRDRGFRALVQRVYRFGAPQVAMGILEADGAQPAAGAEGNQPLTVLDVGTWAEFGTESEPERSFIRAWFDQAEPQLREEFAKLLQEVLKGTKTKEQVLELVGLRGQGAIQARIAAGIDPPNAPSTIERKGSSKPLIDTGQLRSSISFAVRERGR